MPPEHLGRIKIPPGGQLRTVSVEFQPIGRSGRRRKTKLEIIFSLIVIPYSEQYLVIVPKLSPPMRFYLDSLDNLDKVAADELKNYFYGSTAEEIMEYEYAKEEKIDNISVHAKVRAPLEKINEDRKTKKELILDVGTNLVARVRDGYFTHAYQVDDIINNILEILSSEKRESIILLGESMVGKTAIINEVAYRIAKGQCPSSLKKREIWQLSPHSIEVLPLWWENILSAVVDYAREENAIIFFEDIIDLLEGVTSFVKGPEMAKFLKDFVTKHEITIIGEATPEKYEKFLGKDFGFLSLFKTIRINHFTDEKTYQVLNSVRKELELKNDIGIETNAIDAAIELTKRFRPYWFFPGKAVHLLIQTVGSLADDEKKQKILTKSDVIKEFARQTGMPAIILSDEQPLELEEVKNFFQQRIIGQNEAVNEIIDLISKIKAGINDPQKPLGTFIFIGPTGVGKTLLAKTLAEYLFGSPERLVRFDMSEYAGEDALVKLLGVPGSYRERGHLTKHIVAQPFSVILLDEIEKANYAVFDLLLQVLGEGRLTDASGTTVDFRNAVIIMTSNLGASSREISSIGFLEKGISLEQHFIEKLEDFFKPEFINRIDHIIVFKSLSKEDIQLIAKKELDEVVSRYGFVSRRVNIEIDEQIVDLLIEKGFSPVYGARPLKRAIERIVISPIARYLATHREEEIGLIKVMR